MIEMRKYRQLRTALIAVASIAVAYATDCLVSSESFAQEAAKDFSKFQHDDPNHSRLPCLLCHRRQAGSVQPTLPGKDRHTPCIGCHESEFARGSGPICTICHTDVATGAVKAFPPLRSFGSSFDHARHAATSVTCISCHRPARRGVARTIPIGLKAHEVCF